LFGSSRSQRCTVYPPWTVNFSQDILTTGPNGPEWQRHHFDWNWIQFRWFFAPPKWIEVTQPGHPTAYFTGVLRYDLLALELFMVSAVAAGLLLVTSRQQKPRAGTP
jgi:hypothetical protein